jgi:hypothetical protein
MSLVIDEGALCRMLKEKGHDTYKVTASNLGPPESGPPLEFPSGISGTVSIELPFMSSETREKLLALRHRIVDSGLHLMTTEELDNEVAERKGRLLED